MRPTTGLFAFGLLTLATSFATPARAQQPLPPLPSSGGDSQAGPLPPTSTRQDADGSAAAGPEATPGPLPQTAPPPAYRPTQREPREDDEPDRPPAYAYEVPPEPTHAPKFSLYAGARLGLLGFGGDFYDNEAGKAETTGNFVGRGIAGEVDVGARLGYRYVPYLFLEHGFMGKGHRFEGVDATASSDLYGIGFRYTAGNPNTAGFLTEISVGIRTVTVKSGSQTYKMSSFEIFRLGLGAEIRLSTLFVLSPMAQLSGGSMSDTDGDITYGPDGSKDGLTRPTYRNGDHVASDHPYVVVGIGCGAHFDIFGK